MKKLIVLFIDGIGLAPRSGENPVCRLFEEQTGGYGLVSTENPMFFEKSLLIPLDATLDVKGEPQSATGQTSIFTGVNAAALLGYHLPAFPNEQLVAVIKEKSIMKALAEKGIPVTSANMYSEKFFTDRRESEKNRFPVSTLTIEASGAAFRMAGEYNERKAVFADITGEMLVRRGFPVEEITPEEAGKRILRIAGDFPFVFFEYFLTDHFGHKRKRSELDRCVEALNRFVSSITSGLAEEECLLIVSDHGNAEDMTTGGHTRNPVPGLLIGDIERRGKIFSQLKNLTDLYNFMLEYFD